MRMQTVPGALGGSEVGSPFKTFGKGACT